MYYIPRGGNRGGADQFSWSDVKTDKDREYYLGHSLNAPVGRWQEGRDLQWFSKARNTGDDSIANERRAVKQAEKEAMMAALGQKVVKSQPSVTPTKQLNTTEMVSSLKRITTKDVQKKSTSRSLDKRKSKKHKSKKSEMKKMKSRKRKHRRHRSSSESSTDSSSESDSSESEVEMARHKRRHQSSSGANQLHKRRKSKSSGEARRSKYHDDADGKQRKMDDLRDRKNVKSPKLSDTISKRETQTRDSSKRHKTTHSNKKYD